MAVLPGWTLQLSLTTQRKSKLNAVIIISHTKRKKNLQSLVGHYKIGSTTTAMNTNDDKFYWMSYCKMRDEPPFCIDDHKLRLQGQEMLLKHCWCNLWQSRKLFSAYHYFQSHCSSPVVPPLPVTYQSFQILCEHWGSVILSCYVQMKS